MDFTTVSDVDVDQQHEHVERVINAVPAFLLPTLLRPKLAPNGSETHLVGWLVETSPQSLTWLRCHFISTLTLTLTR